MFGVFAGHVLHSQYRTMRPFVDFNHLFDRRLCGFDQVICKQYREGFVSDNMFCAQHRVPQSQRIGLPDEGAFDVFRNKVLDAMEEIMLAVGMKLGLEFIVLIKMILDGPLVPAGNEHHLGNPCPDSFFNGVLDERFIDDGQHFFGACLSLPAKTGFPALPLEKLPCLFCS